MDLIRYLFGSSKRDIFAQRLLRRIKEAGETREIRYERDTYQFRFFEQGEPAGSANLGKLFHQYDRLPAGQRDAFLTQIAREILAHHKPIPEAFEDAQCDILPIVRSRSYLETENLLRRLQGEPKTNPQYLEIGDHLLAVPIYDLPETTRRIDPQLRQQWNRSLYELMETSLENLDQIKATITTLDERVFLFRNQDNYDAARLLLLERIRDLPVHGLPVAMVPARDCLMITGDEDNLGMQLMVDIARQHLQDPYPISVTPCRMTGEGWQTWLPPPGHPLHREMNELRLQGLVEEYRTQHEAIETTLAATGRKGFVANYYLFRDLDTRELISYCVWPECSYALLPQTDIVVFMDQHHMKPLASGKWASVQAILGSQLEDLETYPPRFRVLSFPSEDALRQIGSIPRFRL
ncbi:DUF1444 family protein [Blastopirellula marina]|uniref:DUF1444 domain-containing protein n=1 Tax=Blastopirellula marina TaxID=124 RepID=A0A2S8FLG0_9BACT|nr:DUF1444 family protein [Blastopirellula marina]PQO32987.1 hypothetical protein C5Y98_17775 [Blastopirellula marina]PTL43154.1 hypothetical protein C5Y97_17785 [Blastopirellula marina]